MTTISTSKALGGALIIGGTAIGAGMLALPIVTGVAGFLPATVIYFICWLFSVSTGLLLLEVCLWMPKDANIITMSEKLLGPVGKFCAWILYLFLFYCLTVAYVTGGGQFIVSLFNGHISHEAGLILFTLVFGSVVYMGTKVVDRMNFILMIGLALAYFSFVFLSASHVEFDLLKRRDWFSAALALPVIFTSFSFQGTVPSLVSYLERNMKAIRFAIIGGTLLPLVTYIVWEFLVLGIIPLEGKHGLLAAQAKQWTAIDPLKALFSGSSIHVIGQFFGAFALTTSFLGVTLGLLDFLADGLKISKDGFKKLGLCAIIYIPPIIISSMNPMIFLGALGYAGGIGCALLLGLFPTLMVWVGRYKKGYQGKQQLPGGKVTLVLLSLFVIFELCVEILKEFS